MNFDSIRDQVSNLSLYDLKAGVRKVQNAVMNYTEMEAKVREATNNEPWGASSTLMQEIANGTFNYQLHNEIMPMIYKRFTEKAREEWRQIYKGLQLLEFLIKNGSERVIDDARSHLSLLKMLRQFDFIDQNGKDQGINVRNRAKELADLLGDVDRIRAERKKARANRNKFGGVEGGAMGGGMSSGSKYGGFSSEEAEGYGGYSGRVYGDGGGFGGNTGGFQDSGGRRDRFEEYDEFDNGAATTPGRRKSGSISSPRSVRREPKKPEPLKKEEPEVDLFSFGDDDILPEAPPKSSHLNGKSAVPNLPNTQTATDEDDFDDFQAAAPTPSATISRPSIPGLSAPPITSTVPVTHFAAPAPRSVAQGVNLDDLVGFTTISPAPSSTTTMTPPPPLNSNFSQPSQQQQQLAQSTRPTTFQSSKPNYYTSVQARAPTASSPQPASATGARPSFASANSFSKPMSPAAAKSPSSSASGDAFGNLWSTASAGAGIKKSGTPGSQGPKLADMAKEKASAGIWGSMQTQTQTHAQAARLAQGQGQGQQQLGGGLDDLLG